MANRINLKHRPKHFAFFSYKFLSIESIVKFIILTNLSLIGISSFSQGEVRLPQEIAKIASQSTVLIILEDFNGDIIYGSGFFINSSEIVTNYHVIEGTSQGIAKIVSTEDYYSIEGVSAIDQDNDLAILRVSEHGPSGLIFSDSDVLEIGETIYVFGSPSGLEGTFSNGIVSSIRTYRDNKRIQITAPVSSGSSGGPVLNVRGEVVGVAYATLIDGQNLNFAIPSNIVLSLSSQSGPFQALSDIPISNNYNGLNQWQKISAASILVRNNTNYQIDFLFLSSSESQEWGVDILGSTKSFKHFEFLEYYVLFGAPCKQFDIMAIDTDGDIYYKWLQRVCDRDDKYINITLDDLDNYQIDLKLAQVDIYNKTGYNITHLYFTPVDSGKFLTDVLGSAETLLKNDSISFFVHNDNPISSYSLIAFDEDSDIYTKMVKILNNKKHYIIEIKFSDLEPINQ